MIKYPFFKSALALVIFVACLGLMGDARASSTSWEQMDDMPSDLDMEDGLFAYNTDEDLGIFVQSQSLPVVWRGICSTLPKNI